MKLQKTHKKIFWNRRIILNIGLALLVVSSMFLCACATDMPVKEDATVIESVLGSVPYEEMFGSNHNYDYEVPESLPNVLVDRIGYEAEAEKTVLFRGEDLADTFEIVDAVTLEVCYAGDIKMYDDTVSENEVFWYGNFSDFTETGIYYIQTDVIGRSYDFRIQENIYAPQLLSLCNSFYETRYPTDETGNDSILQIENDSGVLMDVAGGWATDEWGNRDVVVSSGAILNLLMAYELNPACFTDANGLPHSGNNIPDMLEEICYEMEWMLKLQDISGGVYGGVYMENSTQDSGLLPISAEATAAFCAVSGRFSGMYHEYNAAFSDQCLYQAEEAYEYLKALRQENRDAFSEECWYLVNAELFRTTGKTTYRYELLNILNDEIMVDSTEWWNPVFAANYAYLTTNSYADPDLCYEIMSAYMDKAEQYSLQSSNDRYRIDAEQNYTLEANRMILEKMQVMTYINFVITNKEYRTVIQEHIHYLMGRNPSGSSYVSGNTILLSSPEQTADSSEQMYYKSILILILSNIENRYVVESN